MVDAEESRDKDQRENALGLPEEVMCDRDCGHVGVTEIDGERLCRPHEMEVRGT